MLTRRTAVATLSAAAIIRSRPSRAAGASFDELLAKALDQPEIMVQSLAGREGPAVEFEIVATRAVAPRYKPSDAKLSDDAIKMVIVSEVSSQARYEARGRQPTWPGGASGVTIGIGYDVGYETAAWLQEDWGGVLPAADLAQLQKACKVTGTAAQTMTKGLGAIQVDWAHAYQQFTTTALPRWTAETIGNLPNANKLSPDCLGALVSIDYNRGPGWKLLDDRHREMRAIRLHLVNEDYALIPGEIRSMARLWPPSVGLPGLVIRRNLEAALFEKGLKAS